MAKMPEAKTTMDDKSILEIEALQARIAELENAVSLGLNWREMPENVERLLEEEVPVFSHVKSLDVKGAIPGQSAHILIEGDNLHALYTLQATHKELVDVIYIDPPYNTGNEFIYNDKLIDKENRWRHSAWLSFMDKRLRLASNLLSADGLIFVSIDDNEVSRLRLLMDSIFGEDSWVSTLVWRSDGNLDNQAQIKINHEYIHVYSRNKESFRTAGLIDPNVDEDSKLHNEEIRNSVVKNGPKNPVSSITLPVGFPASFADGTIKARTDSWPHYAKNAIVKNGKLTNEVVVSSGWANARLLKTFIEFDLTPVIDTKGQSTIFELTSTGAIDNVKQRSEGQSHVLSVLFNMGTTETAGNKLKKMGLAFPFPKPVSLIEYLIGICSKKDALVLDFFAGSGTTLEAVANMNSVDDGSRRCIIVTNNENNICREVTLPRCKAVLSGNWDDGTHEALPGSLKFYKTSFMKRRRSPDRMRTDVAAHTVDLVSVREMVIDVESINDDLSILYGNGRTIAVVPTIDADHKVLHSLANAKVREGDLRRAYLFTWNNQGIEPEIASLWPEWDVEPLPAEMLAELRNLAPARGLFDVTEVGS